jgi:hypothetical protein
MKVRKAAAAVPRKWGIGVPANGGLCGAPHAPIIAALGGNPKEKTTK